MLLGVVGVQIISEILLSISVFASLGISSELSLAYLNQLLILEFLETIEKSVKRSHFL
jgi:hypothetical protein